jgi:hypothetical protein
MIIFIVQNQLIRILSFSTFSDVEKSYFQCIIVRPFQTVMKNTTLQSNSEWNALIGSCTSSATQRIHHKTIKNFLFQKLCESSFLLICYNITMNLRRVFAKCDTLSTDCVANLLCFSHCNAGIRQ